MFLLTRTRKHDIFGIGEVKSSRPKGENYRLQIDFEDGTNKTLLSTFIEIHDGAEETVEAEAIVAEPVEAEAVLDTDVVYRRPEDKEDTETVIDLSKPEVQDAEIVDE